MPAVKKSTTRKYNKNAVTTKAVKAANATIQSVQEAIQQVLSVTQEALVGDSAFIISEASDGMPLLIARRMNELEMAISGVLYEKVW